MERYNSLNNWLQKKYGQKVYKLALDTGLTCPNRDGTVGEDGCIFCADGGSGHFAKRTLEEAKAFLHNRKEEPEFRETQLSHMQYDSDTRGGLPTHNSMPSETSSGYDVSFSGNDFNHSGSGYNHPALEKDNEPADLSYSYGSGWERQTKNVGSKYIAYFQTYSGTYAPSETLREMFRPALEDDEIVGLAIATRPDCLKDDVLKLLDEVNKQKPLWVELGLQTMHEKTAEYIGRGYSLEVFEDALRKLRHLNIDAVVHLIMGLPGETPENMLDSIRYLNKKDIQGIKIHMLTVIKGTKLGDLYEEAVNSIDQATGPVALETSLTFSDGTIYPFITLDKYADLICACIGLLRPEIVIHRITGDAPKDRLLAPIWTADKKRVLNRIHQQLERRNITQGCLLSENI